MKIKDIMHYSFINFKKNYRMSVLIGISILILSFFVSFILILTLNLNKNYEKTSLYSLNDKVIYRNYDCDDPTYILNLIKNNKNDNLNLATDFFIDDEWLICKNIDRNQLSQYNANEIIINKKLNYSIGDELNIEGHNFIVKNVFESEIYDIELNLENFTDYNIYIYFSMNDNGFKGVNKIINNLQKHYFTNESEDDAYMSYKASFVVMNILNSISIILIIVTIIFFALTIVNCIILQNDKNDILHNVLVICGIKKRDLFMIEFLNQFIFIFLTNLCGCLLSLLSINIIKRMVYKISYALGANILEGFLPKYIFTNIDIIAQPIIMGAFILPIILFVIVFFDVNHKLNKSIYLLEEVNYEK